MEQPGPLKLQAEDFHFSDEEFENIRNILVKKRGFDTNTYKDRYMKRRISIRIRATGAGSATAYRELLATDQTEIDRLVKVLTIHVSQFFRNFSTFDTLKEEILPRLFARLAEEGRDEARIWSAGCASGEEAYSLCILLQHFFPERLQSFRVSILGTDVDAGVLEKAAAGIFPPDRLAEMPRFLVDRFFVQEKGQLRLSEEIIGMMRFARTDLLGRDPYPASDLILCRNVLIYFDRPKQEEVISRFADALSPGGILVLGRSETLVGETRKRFECISSTERIYRRIH